MNNIEKRSPFLVKKKTILFLGFTFLFILLGIYFRGFVMRGADTGNYVMAFLDIQKGNFIYSFGLYWWMKSSGFFIVSYITRLFTDNPYLYLFVVYFIYVYTLLVSYSKCFRRDEKTLFFIAILVLLSTSTFYFFSLNVIRQSLAASTGMLSMVYLMNRQRKKSFICIMISLLCHKSAILYLGVFIFNKYFKRINPIQFLYLCLIISVCLQTKILASCLGSIGLYAFKYKILEYSDSARHQLSKMFYIKAMIMFGFAHVFYFFKKYSSDEVFKKSATLFIYLVSFAFLFFSQKFLMNRFMLYPVLFYPILFSKGVYSIKQKSFYCVMLLLFTLIYFGYIITNNSVQINLTPRKFPFL